MSKNIAISDDVYERLKREKGDRSFSEVIADALDAGARLEDVTGAQVLDRESVEEAQEILRGYSAGTIERLENESV